MYPRDSMSLAVRGRYHIQRNVYTYWQMTVSESYLHEGYLIGVGTRSLFNHLNMLGLDPNNWALSNNGLIWHNNCVKYYCNSFRDNVMQISCLFNGFNGDMAFFVDGVYKGIAFRNIPMHENLYPWISSTVSNFIVRFDCCLEVHLTAYERAMLGF